MSEEKQVERQIWHLPKPWILEELYSRRWVIRAMWMLCAALVVLFIWAAFAEVDETALAIGELQPMGGVLKVDHQEGGTVTKVWVKDGDLVKAGDPLVQLDEEGAKAELDRLKTKVKNLSEDEARLTAYIRDARAEGTHVHDDSAMDDAAFLRIQQSAKTNQLTMAQAAIEAKTKEILKLQEQAQLTQNQLTLAQEEESMYVGLVQQGVVSKRDYLRVQSTRIELQKKLADLLMQGQQAHDGLVSAKAEYSKTLGTLNETAAKDLNAIQADLSEAQKLIPKYEDTLSRALIRAPEAGQVKGLEAKVGQVIPPAGNVLMIVPQQKALEVKVQIQPEDIGFIHVGEPANVKISAYDFARYGSIEGTVSALSATTFMDDKGHAFYRGIVTLNTQYVNQKAHALKAGMTARVDIITGQKTVLEYLLKPIHLTFNSALHER